MEPIHQPVLSEAVLELLAPADPAGLMVDATLGEGGHARLFLENFPRIRLVALDADRVMLRRAEERLADFAGRIEFRAVWFDDYFSEGVGGEMPHRVLLDLGVSMYHFHGAGRGFSLTDDSRLDMRLDDRQRLSAWDVVNRTPEKELADIIYSLGEERLSRVISRAIVRSRQQAPIETAEGLAEIIRRAVPREVRYRRIHPATRTFQALRILVNDELERLSRGLAALLDLLPPAGRVGVISFHSLEDRIVKRAFVERERASADAADSGNLAAPSFRRVNKKPVTAAGEEISANAASRSAKLRVIERVA